ncbi:MAG: hypothetical protein M1818_006399 [Claussenomyces sp. TS43310]|nr:MAG: hypothetical protein M1818_006399 [Claussenomyces sp. TS43310]
MAAAIQAQEELGHALVSFSRDGVFPEEEISATFIKHADLPAALTVLNSAASDLEKDIRHISGEYAPSVDAWIENATALQADANRSKKLASEIIRQGATGDALQQAVHIEEERARFLQKEAVYNRQLRLALEEISEVIKLLDHAEHAALERQVLEALRLLSSARVIIHDIPSYNKTRAIRLLDERAFMLRLSLENDFGSMWEQFITINKGIGSVTINQDVGAGSMNVEDAIAVIQAFGKTETCVSDLKQTLLDVIIKPRIGLGLEKLSSIAVDKNILSTSVTPADRTIKSLFIDLERIVCFMIDHLPEEFAMTFSQALMPDLCLQIRSTWLDSAVPISVDDLTTFRDVIAVVQSFVDKLTSYKWAGTLELQDWVDNTPRIWLTKRRETCLDWTRNRLALGVSLPTRVDRIETQILPAVQLMGPDANDWDSAWSDDGDQEIASSAGVSRPSVKSDVRGDSVLEDATMSSVVNGKDDDEADAWGWNDEDIAGDEEDKARATTSSESRAEPSHQGTVTLTENYAISSMPDPVLRTIINIVDDGTNLIREEDGRHPVAAAAVGLFALPTLVLAMYRAVSPHYYTLTAGGNMYLYNDSMWLAEQLRSYLDARKAREDLPQQARGKIKLENDIVAIEIFGRRAYGNEMSTQRTILNDLLGGTQNFLQQEGQTSFDDEATIDTVVSLVRTLSSQWKPILTRSAWAQATGSLLSTIAKKIILDVQDLSSLGADEAYRIANLIAKVVRLDELFLPENEDQPQIPVTSQYAPNWLKLHFLSEVLQSNLKDVRYLWFESDLSLYFRAQEVIDLIELSFEDSPRSREVIAAIREKMHPRRGD